MPYVLIDLIVGSPGVNAAIAMIAQAAPLSKDMITPDTSESDLSATMPIANIIGKIRNTKNIASNVGMTKIQDTYKCKYRRLPFEAQH